MLRIELLDWDAARPRAGPIRFAVFVDEQGVPAEMELDADDPASLHALALPQRGGSDLTAVGTGRLLPAKTEAGRQVSHIGRMAVLRDWRGRGVGAALLDALVASARARGDEEIVLAAQVHALGFYASRGFVAEGEAYPDAGIPHRDMRLRLLP